MISGFVTSPLCRDPADRPTNTFLDVSHAQDFLLVVDLAELDQAAVSRPAGLIGAFYLG